MTESLTESPTEAVIEPEQTTRGGRDGFGLILASASPRRRELLAILVADFEVRPADIDERSVAGEAPADHVRRLAVEKACAVAEILPGRWVIGSDTEVVLDGACQGKPRDERQAGEMLRSLSGRSHAVYSSVALVGPDSQAKTALCVSEVRFDAFRKAGFADTHRRASRWTRPAAMQFRGRRRPGSPGWTEATAAWSVCRCSKPPGCSAQPGFCMIDPCLPVPCARAFFARAYMIAA